MAEKISKQEAVRRALGKLGHDAKPVQMQSWIKDQFKLDMSTDHISTAKGQILKGDRAGKPPATQNQPAAAKPAAPQKSPAPPKAAPKPSAPKAAAKSSPTQKAPAVPSPAARDTRPEAGIPLADILYIKALVGRFGPEQLHTLIDAFAK